MKNLTILGTRPQFIKAGSVGRKLAKYSNIIEVIVDKGRHCDTNVGNVFYQIKTPKTNYFLGVGSKPHGASDRKSRRGYFKGGL